MNWKRLLVLVAGLPCTSLSLGQVCAPGSGDCCTPNGNDTPGCDDRKCCDTICADFPSCCEIVWDSVCAELALAFCAICDEFPPMCENCGTCDGDVNCDGVVDSLDVGELVNRWHPCMSGNCRNDVNCDGKLDPLDAGYIQARLGTCDPPVECTICPTPPPSAPLNDACQEAIDIENGVTAFSTIEATTDGPGLPAKCTEGFSSSFVNDVWYHYVADCTGTVTVSTCDDADFDTRLAAYTGPCPVTNEEIVGCNDDGDGCGGFTSIMQFAATKAVDYKLRIGGFGGSGTGNLTISCE